MPLDSTLTYNQTPPRRPTLDDLNGGALANDAEEAPAPGIDPDARAMNQSDKLAVAAHGVIEHTRIQITFSGATPSKTGIWSLREGLALSDFTLNDAGTGITEITHTGGKLPAGTWPAEAYCYGTGDSTAIVEPIANGWRVRTRTAGAAADVNFVLKLSGAGV